MTKSNDRGDRITAYKNNHRKEIRSNKKKLPMNKRHRHVNKNEEIPRKDYGRSRERNQKEIEYSYFPTRR